MIERTDPLDRRTVVATVLAAFALALFAMNDVPLGIFQDDGHYAILARALAHGEGFRYTNLPGAPFGTHFPPGFPILLAPLWWMAPRFPQNVAFFKLVNVALYPAAALALRAMARRIGGFGALGASLLAIGCLALVPFLFLNGLLFSETAFIVALIPVLLMTEQVVAEAAPSVRRLLMVGVAIGALSLLRTVGLALLPAAVGAALLARRPRVAGSLVLGALFVLGPWQWWTSAHATAVPVAVRGGYGPYIGWMLDAYRVGGLDFAQGVLRTNLDGLRIPLTLFGVIDQPWWAQLAVGLPLLIFLGRGARHLWPTAPVAMLLPLPYAALLLAWPFPPDRFLWPLWPLLLVTIAVGARLEWHATAPARQLSARIAVGALLALTLAWHLRTWPSRSWERGERGNARMGLAAAAAAATLPANDLVASDMDAMVHLYANRPAVPVLALTAEQHVRTRTDDEVAGQLGGVLNAYHPRWVLVTERESLRAAQALVRRGRLRLAGVDSLGVLVYSVVQ